MITPLLTVQIRYEHDVVLSRQRARQIGAFLGFEQQDQVRIATSVSEMGRNIFQYAKQGKIEFLYDKSRAALQILCSDQGPGIKNLKTILEGHYVSKTGMGLGLLGARKLMDRCDIESGSTGTRILLEKFVPVPPLLQPKSLEHFLQKLSADVFKDPFFEIQRQNQELISTLDLLQQRQVELDQLNKELEDTNRGVVALYAELDEKADYLRRASEVKSRFLSNMTHEFRTPLNSVLGLSRMLLDRSDGELTADQEKQVSFIRRAANDLSELVNDLLDISKVEAGKIIVRPSSFEVNDLFGALRGMLRPLLSGNTSVNLVFHTPPTDIPPITTDESKLSQILRNFISNSLKYTDQGEISVSARLEETGHILFSVADTGIGIAPEDLDRIFEEFTQIEGPHQKKAKGTGLGLSISKKLVELLGGSVHVESVLGKGSTFSVSIPVSYPGDHEIGETFDAVREIDPSRLPVLIVEDNKESIFIYESYLKESRFQVLPARSLRDARQVLKRTTPKAIVVDIVLDNETSWDFISELKQSERYRNIPLLVVTMVDNEKKARELGANAFCLKPIDKKWLLDELNKSKDESCAETILIVDDDPVSRYLFRSIMSTSSYRIVEAGGGHDGLRAAAEEKPALIFLDMAMPDLDGFEFLKRQADSKELRSIPTVIYSTKPPRPEELDRLGHSVAGVLTKDHSSKEKSHAKIMEMIETVLGANQPKP